MANGILDDFIKETDQAPGEMKGIKIVQAGRLLAAHHWQKEKLSNVHSVAKSFLATAVGFALTEALLSLDENLVDLFPEYVTEENEETLKNVTVRHLLSMSHGQAEAHLMMDQRENLQEIAWVKYSLNQPFKHQPGQHFLYSNVGPYLVGVALEQRTEMTLVAYLTPRLFDPLGFSNVVWEKDPLGRTFAAGGLWITLTDLAKFGQFYLQKGQWEGQQLLAPGWLKLVTTPKIKADASDPFTKYYGYGFWIHPNQTIYRADGAFGQMALVLPEKEAVIAISSKATDTAQNMEKIFRLIYPKL
jgi:CubicO group peptidase (beta-lactamase class C family)